MRLLGLLVLGTVLGACVPPAPGEASSRFTYVEGGIVRGDTTRRELALVFTGHEFADGGDHIRAVLAEKRIPASFFFTGDFYRNPAFASLIAGLKADGHYLGAHSDKHLLYCAWESRDRLLVTRDSFDFDLENNYQELPAQVDAWKEARYFLPPYEWYNRQISSWAKAWGVTVVNFTPGTRSTADYTTPNMGPRYQSSEVIFESILAREQSDPNGLNGFLLLLHIGTDPARTDKFYHRLGALVDTLQSRGYRFERVDRLLAR